MKCLYCLDTKEVDKDGFTRGDDRAKNLKPCPLCVCTVSAWKVNIDNEIFRLNRKHRRWVLEIDSDIPISLPRNIISFAKRNIINMKTGEIPVEIEDSPAAHRLIWHKRIEYSLIKDVLRYFALHPDWIKIKFEEVEG